MNNDKKLIIKYILKDMLPITIGVIIFSSIIMFGISKINNEIKVFALLFLGVIVGVIVLIFAYRLLSIILSSNINLTDGYICDRRHYTFSDGSRTLYGRARTLDESKTTKEQRLPYSFIHGNIPVKILIHNDKVKGFFVTDESYNYVKENRGELEKRQIKISKIVTIVFALLFLIYFIKIIIGF